MLSQLWPEEPPGVYDCPVVLKSDLTNGLILIVIITVIVSETIWQSENLCTSSSGPCRRKAPRPQPWVLRRLPVAHSQFYKSIHISYPSEHDRDLARQNGVSPGGSVFIHGLSNGYGAIGAAHRLKDWTDGCIAVTNEEIDDIWKAVPDGTAIEIRP